MDRNEVGRKVMETSQVMSEGYTRAISEQFMSAAEIEANQKCAIAASNTGYFILQALGFSSEEIRVLRSANQQTTRES